LIGAIILQQLHVSSRYSKYCYIS